MNTAKIKKHLDWEKYYNPNFNWLDENFYKFNRLSEDFIREFADKVDWAYISLYTELSEDFIREFQDYVYWSVISTYQTLSEDFIVEFKDKVDWKFILANQILSNDFKKQFRNYLWKENEY